MCQINYVSENLAIMDYCCKRCVSGSATLLWLALFRAANDRQEWNDELETYDWPDDFFMVDNRELTLFCKLEKRAMLEARNQLKQMGVIDFKPGENHHRPARYKINYLTGGGKRCKIAPVNAPVTVPVNVPVSVPVTVPADVPFYTKNKSIAGEEQRGVSLSDRMVMDPDARARGRLEECYTDADGEEQPCRYDEGWQHSESVRRSVAGRILRQFHGDIDNQGDALEDLCEWMRNGMPPELMEDCVDRYTAISDWLRHCYMLFQVGGYAARKKQLEREKWLRRSGGNEAFTRFMTGESYAAEK